MNYTEKYPVFINDVEKKWIESYNVANKNNGNYSENLSVRL